MQIIRPIRSGDYDALFRIAELSGTGFTSLPANAEQIENRIQRAVASFAQTCAPASARYLFALEDTDSGKVVGVCGLDARVGLDDVWYNYRLSTMVSASQELGVHVQTPTLFLTNDMTNRSELCTLFLETAWRRDGLGYLLSLNRFLFLADFRSYFSDMLFAEMRGVNDDDGRSPFWDALGKRFFNMDFAEADYLTGLGNKSFIAELMPKYPIYLPLLPQAARDVIGEVHENTRPALRMLQGEGLHFNGLVDIFDAGPVVECFVDNTRVVRDSFKRHVLITKQPLPDLPSPREQIIVSNRSFAHYRAMALPASLLRTDTISIPASVAEALQVESGDLLRIVPMRKHNQ